MESLKQKFDDQERLNREQFENFVQKKQESEYITNALIFKMRFYHYKELMKAFALNFKSAKFESSRNSVYLFLVAPASVALAFNIFSPFSMLRGVGSDGTFGSIFTCFAISLREEMHAIA